jgi:hypothetical protein
MSVIEDPRKLIQDFLAPELREISTRLDAIEKHTDQRFDAAERLATERHAQTLRAIAQLADVYELKERVARIEAREKAN